MAARSADAERCRHRRLREDRGAALVEFALVVPLLLLLLLGLVDFGKAFTMWIDETHIANQAGRYAAVNKWTDSGGVKHSVDSGVTAFEDAMEDDGDTQELRDRFDDSTDPEAGVHVCLDSAPGTGGQIGDPIRVDVEAKYQFLGFIGEYVESLVPKKPLRAHSTMRIETAYSAAFINDASNHC